ncbi:restriction endonuclease subunit S [Exiguobacterium chiriqhucha]|uniref:Type I restriction modification DNA specificity domain-containing protein n=1 Tax=Exiguobacterium chiriqhucha RW-2 TaxID=1345023 RepID=U1M050_9BACL|nr:restriction endonuclease subunit S [Exiguobacterium chiriqhucha]ERG68037.1 hypothetical protein M467_12170 [Exiguobacterium chiriqhucha RW-2]
MTEQKNLLPKRRFKQFHNEIVWNQLELKKIAPLQRGFDLTKSSMKSGPYPVVFSNGIGAWNSEYKVKGPGVVTGRSGSIGNVSYIDDDFWPHNTSLWVTNFFDNYPLFIYYLYQNVNLTRFGSGSGVPTLNRNDVHDYSTSIPKIDEQIRIGNFLKHFDDLIILQQHKLEKTKELKAAYLSEMFPAEGEFVPKRRFTKFDDDWKQRKVFEFGNQISSGGTPKTSCEDYWNGNIPWIQSSDLTEDIVVIKESRKKITEEAVNNSATKIIPKNSIAVVTRVGVGKLALIPFEYATSQDFLSISNLNLDKWFATYALYNVLQKEKKSVQGTSIKGMTKNDLLMKEIMIPASHEEQQQIGAYFLMLDDLIALHQHKLDKLQNLKKAYLHEMFV